MSPHAGSDVNTIVGSLNSLVISIHTPHAESDLILIFYDGITTLFQSTLPMRGATYKERYLMNTRIFQSTLPMRGATGLFCFLVLLFFISIHTPHAGSDLSVCFFGILRQNFNPHSPCGERQNTQAIFHANDIISIHTPHAGSDFISRYNRRPCCIFQSTLPMRGATPPQSNFLSNPKFQSTLPMRGATEWQRAHPF